MAEVKNLFTGDKSIVEDTAVAVSIERYNELIRKETVFDMLMENKGINLYLYQKMEEENNA